MPCGRSLSSMLLLVVPLFTGLLLLPVESLAQDEVSSQAATSEYTAKLAKARALQAKLTNRVACLATRDTEFISQSNQLELDIAKLRDREKLLVTQLNMHQEQQNGRKAVYDSERRKYEACYEEYRRLEARWRTEQKKWNFIASYMHVSFLFNVIEAEIKAAEASLRCIDALGIAVAAERELEKSNSAFKITQDESKRVRESIQQPEKEIAQLKTKISNLRTELQAHKSLLDDLAYALAEAQSVDTVEVRPLTARKTDRISALIDAAIVKSHTTVNRADSLLPQNREQNCLAK